MVPGHMQVNPPFRAAPTDSQASQPAPRGATWFCDPRCRAIAFDKTCGALPGGRYQPEQIVAPELVVPLEPLRRIGTHEQTILLRGPDHQGGGVRARDRAQASALPLNRTVGINQDRSSAGDWIRVLTRDDGGDLVDHRHTVRRSVPWRCPNQARPGPTGTERADKQIALSR